MAKVKVTLKKSMAGQIPQNRAIIKSLGLGKISSSRVFEKTKQLDGALAKIGYMVKVEEVK
jgi:large subunit ribosomal protein L30